MKKIQAIIRTEKLEDVKKHMADAGLIHGMTVSQVLGFGKQRGFDEYIRGQKILTSLLARVQIEIVVPDQEVEQLIDLITQHTQTGEVGDGKIFIIPVEEAVRIRTGERGDAAI